MFFYVTNKVVIRDLIISIYGKQEAKKILRKSGFYHELYKDRKEYRNSRREENHIYWEENKLKIRDQQIELYNQRKFTLFNILGKKCVVCGVGDFDVLNIDHINCDGKEERKIYGNGPSGIIRRLDKMGWPKDLIKSKYQLLCYNHNLTKEGQRDYLEKDPSNLTQSQRLRRKLWEEAFKFFGPCKMCGENNLKFLSLDHIHADGKSDREENGKTEVRLVGFRNAEWPDSLKDDYQLLCFNCHYGKKTREDWKTRRNITSEVFQ